MQSPVSWQSASTGYSVERCLQQRLSSLRARQHRAEQLLSHSDGLAQMMIGTPSRQDTQARLNASWNGSKIVLGMLFAHPDSGAIRQLCERGSYFDLRTKATWDLYFPGYINSTEVALPTDARRVCSNEDSPWYFSPTYFETYRSDLEKGSEGRWRYSGETDLVIVLADLPKQGDVTFEWESLQFSQLTDPNIGFTSSTLSQSLERIMANLEAIRQGPDIEWEGAHNSRRSDLRDVDARQLTKTVIDNIGTVVTVLSILLSLF